MIYLTPSAELFKIAGFSVQTWGALVALGIIIGILFILKEARKKNLPEKAEGMLVFMMISGIIFGRIAYILINPNEFSNIFSWFALWKGGIISWGVLLGVIFGMLAFKLANKIKSDEFFALLDLMAPYLILAIAIGRIGCFLRGCCFGLPTAMPWGVVYQGESFAAQAGFTGAIHPAQLYHSILDFIIFIVLLKLGKKKSKLEKENVISKYNFFNISGSIFLLFLVLYSAERFIVDFFRYHPVNEYAIGLTITQWIFAGLFIVAFIILKIKRKKK